jgi:hypothetical protein
MTLPPPNVCRRIRKLHAQMGSSGKDGEVARNKLNALLAEYQLTWNDLLAILSETTDGPRRDRDSKPAIISVTEALSCLATQIDPAGWGYEDAANYLIEWGFEGVLDYYGRKSLRSRSEKIKRREFSHLRIPPEPRGETLDSGSRLTLRNELLTEAGGVSCVAWHDVGMDRRQFERLRIERLAPAPAPAADAPVSAAVPSAILPSALAPAQSAPEVRPPPPAEPVADRKRKKRRGPEPGANDRFGDRALFPQLTKLMKKEHLSARQAATQLANAGKVGGTGTVESRARRLAERYLAGKKPKN